MYKVSSARRFLSLFLLFCFTFSTLLAIISFWLNSQFLKTDKWVNTSSQLLKNDTVRKTVSEYLASELYQSEAISNGLEKALPQKLGILSRPLNSRLETSTVTLIYDLLEKPNFQKIWQNANRLAHQNLVKFLKGEGDRLSTSNGEVTLDLHVVLENIMKTLGLNQKLFVSLSSQAGEITVVESKRLRTAQVVVRLLQKSIYIFSILALMVLSVFIFINRNRCSFILFLFATSLFIVGAVLLLARYLVGDYIVDSLVSNPKFESASTAVWQLGTSMLHSIALIIIATGVFLASVTFLFTYLRSKTFG